MEWKLKMANKENHFLLSLFFPDKCRMTHNKMYSHTHPIWIFHVSYVNSCRYLDAKWDSSFSSICISDVLRLQFQCTKNNNQCSFNPMHSCLLYIANVVLRVERNLSNSRCFVINMQSLMRHFDIFVYKNRFNGRNSIVTDDVSKTDWLHGNCIVLSLVCSKIAGFALNRYFNFRSID